LVISLTKKLELLAPAGDREALLTALAAGADAVYLGGQLFNARRSAPNFDHDGLQAAADLLHLHQKKLYVTVNTLINDSELGQALDYLGELYNLGVDAVIIQDLGLIRLVRRYLPGLELHASTQMTVNNTEGALFLQGLGLKRIVLARELTRNEVAQIAAATGMEIEVFVHGALCVCYSGQCLFSSMIGGRSGNRGRCAQPCRMEYQLVRNGQVQPTNGSYLLSPKDLALVSLIPELAGAGVTSLKIEGRMKRPEYVHAVVGVYRRALELYYEAPEQFVAEPAMLRELEATFNRGFSTGYFGNNRNTAVMNWKRPNNRGVLLGRVQTFDPATGRIRLKLETDLEVGDQVEFWVTRGGRGTATIRTLIQQGSLVTGAAAGTVAEFAVEGKIFPGDRVFKVFSHRLHQRAEAALQPNSPALQLACEVTVRGEKGRPLEVTYRDCNDREVTVTTKACLETARQRSLTAALLHEHLGRLGNTPYYLKRLDNELPSDLMVPLGELNRARRDAVALLQEQSLQPYRRQSLRTDAKNDLTDLLRGSSNRYRRLPQLSVWVGDLESVKAAVQSGAALVYVGGDELTTFHWSEDHLRTALRLAHDYGARLVMAFPRLNAESQSDLWSYNYHLLTELGEDGLLISDLGLLNLGLRKVERPLYLNYTLNFFNSSALRLFDPTQIKQIAVSPELTLKQIAALQPAAAGPQLEALVHGPLELMISEYCPISTANAGDDGCQNSCKTGRYALRDRMKLDFPVYTDQFCRMHLFNSKDHCLYEALEQFLRKGLAMLRLELKIYPANQVRLITGAYQKRLEQLAAGSVPDADEALLAQFQRLSDRGITKGHYFRGVD
jgi:putative protease